jgi:ABC-type uncharacterized transport system permease subunit
LGETCNSHDGMCEQITRTREDISALNERTKPIPEMKDKIDKILLQLTGMKSFIAGVAAAVSVISTLVTWGVIRLVVGKI